MSINAHKSLLCAGLLLISAVTAAESWGTEAKPKKKVERRSSNFFVPPPPAYMPSILPELQVQSRPPAEPEDPYKKYFYCRKGYEDPKPVKPNKHVTYWNKS